MGHKKDACEDQKRGEQLDQVDAVTISGRTSKYANKHQQAANALLMVQLKLQGFEQNSQLSVSGQVNYLIQQATDPCNMAKLFYGWQPFLWDTSYMNCSARFYGYS